MAEQKYQPGPFSIFIFCVFFLITCKPSNAQDETYVPYSLKDTAILEQISERSLTSLESSFVLPKDVSHAYKKHFNKIKDNTLDEAEYLIRNTTLHDTLLNPYVQGVFKHITSRNPEFRNCRLILTRSPVENAFAFGDGTILVNIGLLAKLENESQLAFVLCHELSHGKFNHVQLGLKRQLDSFFDEDFQDELKELKKQNQYDVDQKVRKLMISFSMNHLYNMRLYEKEADSMGYYILLNTKYDAAQAKSALTLLGKISDPYYMGKLNFAKYFSCGNTGFVFDKEAPKKHSIFQVQKAEEDELEKGDTLQSHPDCAKRAGFIGDIMKSSPPAGKTPNNSTFERMKTLARYEVIQSWFDYEYYDIALYNALQMIEMDNKAEYLNDIVILCLYELKSYMKAHEYSQVVSNVSEDNPKTFNDMLTLLNRIKLADFGQFEDCFASGRLKESREEFQLAALFASSRIKDDNVMADKYRSQYLRLYKDGRFTRLIEEKSRKKKK